MTFLQVDTTTHGSWQGRYGTSGYTIAQGATALPSYAQVTLSGQTPYTWVSSTTDGRALVKPGSSDRLAASWYANSSFTVDVNLTDSQSHPVALYLLDWDSLNGGRKEQVDVLDANNPSTVLDTRTVNSFSGGDYLVWTVSGHVLFRVTNLLGTNFNAVASGLFFGQPGAPQLAAHGQGPGGPGLLPLTDQALTPILEAAEKRWIATGLAPAEIQRLENVSAVVTDLPAGDLGRAPLGGSSIYLDVNGAGYGWFLDPTPLDDTEFPRGTAAGLRATAGSAAAGRMDLLTVVMHELGHVLGRDSVYGGDPADLMDAHLDTGDRRLPGYGAFNPGGSATADPTLGNHDTGSDGWPIPDWWFLAAGFRTDQRGLPWGSEAEVEFAGW